MGGILINGLDVDGSSEGGNASRRAKVFDVARDEVRDWLSSGHGESVGLMREYEMGKPP